ncbi:MAG: hypothetical protein AVDCRST_MAG04-2804, partial [uncultured Acetobacteraceae bacterium]
GVRAASGGRERGRAAPSAGRRGVVAGTGSGRSGPAVRPV